VWFFGNTALQFNLQQVSSDSEGDQMTEMKFFVYGSLSEGQVHFDKIKDFIKEQESAAITGSAYRLKVGYPVVLENGTDQIPGFLVTLNVSELLLNLLDQFHGVDSYDETKSLYQRKKMQVQTSSGSVEASVYFLNPAKLPKNATYIEGGNWQVSLASEPALTTALTDKQRLYINKLGQVSGRDIVPINDLSLYRELMNLELIVDKGRRLALSKLGHEVYRYLG